MGDPPLRKEDVRRELAAGDDITPGHRSDHHQGRISNHVYFAALLEPAVWAAELDVIDD